MWPAHGTEMCGLRVRQCLVVEFASGFGIGCGVGGMFVQNIWFFVFLHARRLIASNEDRQLPFRAEAAQCLQDRGRVCAGGVAHDPGGIDFPSRVQCAAWVMKIFVVVITPGPSGGDFLCAFEVASEYLDLLYRHRRGLYSWH